MKPRKIAIAILPDAAGRLRFARVLVTGTFFAGAHCLEFTRRGQVTHVLPFSRLVAQRARGEMLRQLRTKRAAIRETISAPARKCPPLVVAGRAAA